MIMESELHSVIKVIQAYEHYRQITFLLYIIKDKTSIPGRSIFYDTTGPSYSKETTFPINLLRDLAIESIETTHFFVSDIDVFFVSDIDVFSSETLYESLMLHQKTLHDPKAVLLLKSFLMNKNKIDHDSCFLEGQCTYM